MKRRSFIKGMGMSAAWLVLSGYGVKQNPSAAASR